MNKTIMGPARLNQFLRESNSIEGEDWGGSPDEAAEYALAMHNKVFEVADIQVIHALHKDAFTLFHGGKSPIEFGKWRDHDVRVGRWLAPEFFLVPELMTEYCAEWPSMDSWTAYCRFEQIHPFPDLNGRVGRLLWLAKAVREGYTGKLTFLEVFHYQTLKKFGERLV